MHVEVDRQGDPGILVEIENDIARVLADVRRGRGLAEDARGRRARDPAARRAPASGIPAQLEEARAFLAWLADDHFTFLGFREYELVTVDGEDELRGFRIPASASCGRHSARRASARCRPRCAGWLARRTCSTSPRRTRWPRCIVRPASTTWASSASTRRVSRSASGGSSACRPRLYSTSVTQVPLLRRKVEAVMQRAGFQGASHDAKDLLTILENYPRRTAPDRRGRAVSHGHGHPGAPGAPAAARVHPP